MKNLLTFLLLLAPLSAQVVSIPSGCARANLSTFTLGWTYGPPIASVGGLETFTASPVGATEMVAWIIGDESAMVPAVQLGTIWPDMAGCTLESHADVLLCSIGGSLDVNFPPGFPVSPLLIQAAVLDARPSGFSLSDNTLEYYLN